MLNYAILTRRPTENYRQINERVLDRLIDINPDYEHLPINFYLTSVYDHTLHESFSKVLQKLIDSLPYLEELLNVFCAVRESISAICNEADGLRSPELSIPQSFPI